MIGASCAIVTCHRSPSKGGATGPNSSASEKFIATAKVCTRPMSSEARKRPGERTEAADDDDDEENGSKRRRHGRLGHQRRAGDDARQSRQRRARAEHQHEQARHVVPQHRDHVRMGQRRLNDEADARPGQHDEQRREHRHRDQEHEHAIGGIVRIEEAKGDEIERRRRRYSRRAICPRSSARPLR